MRTQLNGKVLRAPALEQSAKQKTVLTFSSMAKTLLAEAFIVSQLFNFVAIADAGQRKSKAPKTGTEIAQLASNNNGNAQATANNGNSPKKKKKPEIVTKSREVTIAGKPYKFVLQTRDDWDYVEKGVDLGKPIEFSKFTLSSLDPDIAVANLVNRKLTIGEYGWALTGEDRQVFRHVTVDGFGGMVQPCIITITEFSVNDFNQCGLKSRAEFDGRMFLWTLSRDGKEIGRIKSSPSCRPIENLESLQYDSDNCPTGRKRISLK